MLNNWTGMGRLTKDPELRTTQTGKSVVTFTIAVDRDFDRDKTDFISCTAWNKTAEFVSKHFRRGQLVLVSGSLQSRKWADEKGNPRLNWEIQAQGVWFGGDKKQENAPEVVFEELDGDLPF